MLRQLIRTKRRQILIDVNTQKDFFAFDGVEPSRNRRRVLANIRRVMAWARSRKIPVISTCEVYPNHDGLNEIKYCLEGTYGQEKIGYTLLPNRISFPADGNTDFPRNLLQEYRQAILDKRCADPFSEPRIDRLLTEVCATEFIVIGCFAESAVEAMVLGLLQRDKNVSVVVNAVGTQNNKAADLSFRKMKAKGAKLIEVKKLAGLSHLKTAGTVSREGSAKKPEETPVGAAG